MSSANKFNHNITKKKNNIDQSKDHEVIKVEHLCDLNTCSSSNELCVFAAFAEALAQALW